MSDRASLDWTAARTRLERIRESIEEAANPTPAQKEQVFQRRAELLARRLKAPGESAGAEAIMVFRLGREHYALPLAKVAEVIPDPPCAPLPGASPELAGVIQVRSEVRPVLELSTALGLPSSGAEGGGIVLLLRAWGREFGVRIDEVQDIRTVPAADHRAPPAGAQHAVWMTQDLVTVLNPDSLFERGAE